MSPRTTDIVDARFRLGDWGDWPIPVMPSLPVGSEPWGSTPAHPPWELDVRGLPIDKARTAQLAQFDLPVEPVQAGARPWDGSTYGMPFQIVATKGSLTPVWDLCRPIEGPFWAPRFPITMVPLPEQVRREGDPAGGSDQHWYGFDPTERVLFEAIQLQYSPLNRLRTWGQADWVCGGPWGGQGIARWDCSRSWDAPGQPPGVVAAAIPQFPLIVRWDEIARGHINHAVFGVLPNYAPGKTGAARGFDGSWVGHPVRAGERLRLRPDAYRRLIGSEPSVLTPRAVVLSALYEHGWIQGDRSAPDDPKTKTLADPRKGGGGFPTTMDRRFAQGDANLPPLGRLGARLSDFEVLAA